MSRELTFEVAEDHLVGWRAERDADSMAALPRTEAEMPATLSTGWAQGSMATLATLAPAPCSQRRRLRRVNSCRLPYTRPTASPSTPSKATSVPLAAPPIDVQAAFESAPQLRCPPCSPSPCRRRVVVKEEPRRPDCTSE